MLFAKIQHLINALHLYSVPIKSVLVENVGVVVVVFKLVPVGNYTHSGTVYAHVLKPFLPDSNVLLHNVCINAVESYVAAGEKALVHLSAYALKIVLFCLLVNVYADVSVGDRNLFISAVS